MEHLFLHLIIAPLLSDPKYVLTTMSILSKLDFYSLALLWPSNGVPSITGGKEREAMSSFVGRPKKGFHKREKRKEEVPLKPIKRVI